ncbi:MAG: cyclic nucleotide-binding domain-containing protein [Actinomycetes bacterium]
MKSIEQLLSEHPFFNGIGDEVIASLASCARNVHFAPDEILWRTNDPAEHLYVLRRGRVALEITSSVRGAVIVETLDAGDIAGLAWLVPPYHAYLDGRAV